ncbi:hypothetical protein Pth03_33880 [Planotetraspora thailandica]|uniref:Lipoprotein n=1 Tax=Planotetraspora thailandica TaxID=487172 RepID=A0A8J3UZM5_9ACTN|nr:hypothetical protein [Planotetraspora thailandica]GII54999.1 hypothetical protein Pth03_33880 [Planotetraspora thailandica]
MRIIQVVVMCGLIVVAGACGVEGRTYTRAESSAEAARLRTALATLDGLPEGFSARARESWRPPFSPRKKACRILFDAAAGSPPRDGLGGTATATFEGDHIGELAGVGLAVYTGGGGASERLGELRDAMEGCGTARSGAMGGNDRLVATELALGDVGADVEARRLTGRVGGYPYEMHLVVAGVGHTVIALVHAGLTPPDAGRTEELARSLVREVGSLDS